uniref:Heparan-sulfate 6-O-sulfotransferase n=1 Tax=Oncorhynchus kisutch TaxID=8019 RepID=A0A8C7DAB2_ONCKI
MDERSTNHHRLLIALVIILLFGVIVLQYLCPSSDCQLLHLGSLASNSQRIDIGLSGQDTYVAEDCALARFVPRFNFPSADLSRLTGGTTFGRHLVGNIKLERPCECHAGQKKCTCYRPGKRETWLFSRFSTGWSCGLHADWTELTNCVPSLMNTREPPKKPTVPRRNYYYLTILRDQVWRNLSEWWHVQRGATWKASLHVCDGHTPTLAELPSYYPGDDWSSCSLQEFMDCPYNLANNRQVRMLADLSLVGCYNVSAMSKDERWAVLLESYQRETQYLFERIFCLAFMSPFTQLNGTRAASVEVVPETQLQVRHLNQWDEELYEYARDLLLQRFQVARQQERKQARERRQQKRRRLRGKLGSTRLGMGRPVAEWPSDRPQWTETQAGEVITTHLRPPYPERKHQKRGGGEPVEAEVQLPDWCGLEENSTIEDYMDNVEQ